MIRGLVLPRELGKHHWSWGSTNPRTPLGSCKAAKEASCTSPSTLLQHWRKVSKSLLVRARVSQVLGFLLLQRRTASGIITSICCNTWIHCTLLITLCAVKGNSCITGCMLLKEQVWAQGWHTGKSQLEWEQPPELPVVIDWLEVETCLQSRLKPFSYQFVSYAYLKIQCTK